MVKPMIQGVTMCAALCISATALAQAPVYDLGGAPQQAQAQSAPSSGAPASTLEQRIVVLERLVDSRTQMQHRLQQQMDTMQGEIDDLRGAVEVHTNQLEKVLERQRELYLEIDKRVEALKQAGIGSANPVDSPVASPSPSPKPQAPSGQSSSAPPAQNESDAYESALNLILKSGEYDKAMQAFRSFLSTYPNSEHSPNAHYWLGQLLFNQQNWSEATEQFSMVVEQFAQSNKRPDALLKLGVIAERQGNAGKAKALFQQVVNEYPKSSATKLAQSRLSGM